MLLLPLIMVMTMKVNELTVEIQAKLTVDKATAEGCLKMVEIYLNNNSNMNIQLDYLETGERQLKFIGG